MTAVKNIQRSAYFLPFSIIIRMFVLLYIQQRPSALGFILGVFVLVVFLFEFVQSFDSIVFVKHGLFVVFLRVSFQEFFQGEFLAVFLIVVGIEIGV